MSGNPTYRDLRLFLPGFARISKWPKMKGCNFQESARTYVLKSNSTYVFIIDHNQMTKPDVHQRLYCYECFFSSRDEAEFVAHLEQQYKSRPDQGSSAFEGHNGSARNGREGTTVVRPRAANHS